MKKVVIGVEDKELILKILEENNWLFVEGDFSRLQDLYVMSSSESLGEKLPLLVKFDTALTKLKKEHVEYIVSTTSNVIIFTEKEELIPEGVKRCCEMRKMSFQEIQEKHPVMKVLKKLGIERNYNFIEDIPIGQLVKYLNVNWEKFDGKEEIFKILLEINKRLYKVGDDWLYMYLVYGFPIQKRKSWFKFPASKKKGIKDGIVEKIGKYYGMSSVEVNKSWWLIRRLLGSADAKKFGLEEEELKVLNITPTKPSKEKKKVEVVEKKVKYKGLLEM